jgi:hypothetical protein
VAVVEYDCEVCGCHVRKKRSPANMLTPPRFCSRACGGRARKGTGNGLMPNTTVTCAYCGRERRVYRSPSASSPRYCGKACKDAAQSGEGNPAWSGGRIRLVTGYIAVHAPTHPGADPRGYVLEHRLVAESILGRRLRRSEVVHHINGITDDNRPENLRVFASQSEHVAHHRELERRTS